MLHAPSAWFHYAIGLDLVMAEASSRAKTDEPLELAALVRRAATAAPMRHWRPAQTVKSLWRLFAARPVVLLGGLSTAVLRAGVLLCVAHAVGQVVRGGELLAWTVAAALGLFGAAGLGYAGQRLVIAATQAGMTRLRERLVDGHLSQPVDVVLQNGTEGFVLAMTRDAELLGQMARACFGALLPGVVLVLLCLAGITWLLPALALPLVLALALLWLVRRQLSQRLAAQMALTHEGINRLYEQLGGTVQRHELAVSEANEPHEREACRKAIVRTHALTRALADTQVRAAEVDALVLGLSLLGLLASLAAVGGSAVSGPQMASVLFLLLALRGALQGVLNALQEMALGVPALAAIERLLAMPPAPAHHGDVQPKHWRITLHEVGRQTGGRRLVWPTDLTLEPGRIAVLTGDNGAGKTTLLRLLLGLSEPDSGTVCVDGVPWDQIDRTAFRQGVSYLPQNPVLFTGTVCDNIAYAASGATPQAIEDAARAVGLTANLAAWPQGLDTPLGPAGAPLSGGERQRIALARAVLRRPRLLVLDEPTNHLDAPSVQGLMTLLRQLPTSPAVLIVTHDQVLRAQADEVLQMNGGRLRTLGAES